MRQLIEFPLSTGFHARISRGGLLGLSEKQEAGEREKQMAGDPASPYKRAGVAHLLRLFVVEFLCLVRCLYSIIPSSSLSISDIRTLSFPHHLFLLSTQAIIFFLFMRTHVPGTSPVTKKESLKGGRIRLVGRQ